MHLPVPVLLLVVGLAVSGCPGPPDPDPVDRDGDGFTASDDCDDQDADIHPGAEERCDGVDQDCDGTVDEEPVDPETWYLDADDDGHGVDDESVQACLQPDGFATSSDDCDDGNPTVYPGAPEVCLDGVDNDCEPGGSSCALTGSATTAQAHAAWRDLTLHRCDMVDVVGDALPEGVCGYASGLWVIPSPLTEGTPRPGRVADAESTGVDGQLVDLDEDGVLDAFFATGNVLLGPLDGTQEVVRWEDGADPTSIVRVRDVDLDGHVDLVRVELGVGLVSLTPGPLGPGLTAEDRVWSIGVPEDWRVFDAWIEDVVGTAERDVVLATSEGTVLLDGDTRPPTSLDRAPSWPHAVADVWPDITGDGRADVAVPAFDGENTWLELWSAPLSMDGAGEPAARIEPGARGRPSVLALGDLNDDGVLDAVVSTGDSAWHVLAGPIEGPVSVDDAFFRVEENGSPGGTGGASIVDADGDGRMDLWLSSRVPSERYGYWFLGHGR